MVRVVDIYGRECRVGYSSDGFFAMADEFGHHSEDELVAMLRGTHEDCRREVEPGRWEGVPHILGVCTDAMETIRFLTPGVAQTYMEEYRPGQPYLVVLLPPQWRKRLCPDHRFTDHVVCQVPRREKKDAGPDA
jgi:hypothetical protein